MLLGYKNDFSPAIVYSVDNTSPALSCFWLVDERDK